MRHFFVTGAVLVALTVAVSASDYMGWYLGAGIGYGYPDLIAASGQGKCTGSGGKIFAHAGRLYCAHKVANRETGGAATPGAMSAKESAGHTDAPAIYGQRVGFMWQGMSRKPDSKFNDTCAKQSGKVSQHKDGNWYCDENH